MAEGRSRNLRIYAQDGEPSQRRAEDDPLVELARIVSEDGGFHRPRRERQPQRLEAPRTPFSAELEAELTREFDELTAAARQDAERHAGIEAAARRQAAAPEESEASPRAGRLADGVREARPGTGLVLAHRRDPAPGAAGLPALRNATFQDHAPPRIEARHSAPQPLQDDLRGTFPADPEARNPHGAGGRAERTDVLRDDPPEAYDDFDDAFAREFAAIHGRQDADSQAVTYDAYGEAEAAEPYDESYDEDRHEADDSAAPAVVPPSRSKRNMLVLAGVLGVVVLGGGVAAMMAGSNPAGPDAPIPIIKADAEALKIMPEAEEAVAEAPGKMVFDRVAGVAPKSDGPLVERIEEPRDVESAVPSFVDEGPDAFPEEDDALQGESGKIEARISSGAAAEETGEAAEGFTPIGPRRVRTVTIRPDGSVAETQVAEAPAQASGAQTVTTRTVPVTPPEEDAGAAAAAPATGPSAVDAMGDLAAGVDQAVSGVPVAEAAPAGAVALMPRERPAVQVAALPAETREVVAAPSAEATPAVEATPAAPAPSDGYVVQVSSQRSADQAQASFQDLKRRFPSLLGDRQPNIQQADLGAKGVFYRVRVGPMESRAEANRLCERLKSAGGSCFVTR